MEQMLEPVFSEETVLDTRAFFNRFVIGRGTLPSIRIGRQPYGILPATVWSRMEWWTHPSYARTARSQGLPTAAFLARLFSLTQSAGTVWQGLAAGVSHVGKP